MKIGTRISLAAGVPAAAAIVIAAAFFASTDYLGRQMVGLYDGPLMSISYARSAYTNALLARQQLEAGVPDPDALEYAVDDLVTDLEVIAEHTLAAPTVAILETSMPKAETALEAVWDAEGDPGALPQGFAAAINELIAEISDVVDGEAEFGYLLRERSVARQQAIMLWSALFIGVCLAGSGLLAAVTVRRLSRRLRGINSAMLDLAAGDLDVEIGSTGDRDEIGEMARSLAVFRDNGIEKARLEEEDARNQALLEEERAQRQRERAAEAEVKRREAEDLARAEAGRRRAFEDLVGGLRQVLERAGEGDFSARMTEDETLGHLEIRRLVNDLLAGFQDGFDAVSKAIEALAGRDLTCRVQGDFAGAFARIQRNMNEAVEEVNRVLVEFQTNAVSVSSGSSEMAAQVEQLKARTERSSSSLETIKDASHEIRTKVGDIARLTASSKETARKARDVAEQSNEVVTGAVSSVEEMRDIFSQIARAVEVIDDIAMQTNLLALNASVEAARAGEAGRGFSVVASEVRELAHRAGRSASQIGELVQTSSGTVGKGIERVKDAGGKMARMLDFAEEIGAQIDEIDTHAKAQAEETSGIDQSLSELIEAMRRNIAMSAGMAQTNRSLVASASAAEDLTQLFHTGAAAQSLAERKAG